MKEQYGVYSVQPIIVDDIEEELRQGKMIIKTAEEQNIDYVFIVLQVASTVIVQVPFRSLS